MPKSEDWDFPKEFASWLLNTDVLEVTARNIELVPDREAVRVDQVFHVIVTHLTQSTSEPQITRITRITQIKPSSAPWLRPWLVQLECTLPKVGETRRNRQFNWGGWCVR